MEKPKRKRNKSYYSRNGCLQCKKSHKKCDEVQPSCLQCNRKKLQCVYQVNIVLESLNSQNGIWSKFRMPREHASTNTNIQKSAATTILPNKQLSNVTGTLSSFENSTGYVQQLPINQFQNSKNPINFKVIPPDRIKETIPVNKTYDNKHNFPKPNSKKNNIDIKINSSCFFTRSSVKMMELLNYDEELEDTVNNEKESSNNDPIILNFEKCKNDFPPNIKNLPLDETIEHIINLPLFKIVFNELIKQQSYSKKKLYLELNDENFIEFIWDICESTNCYTKFLFDNETIGHDVWLFIKSLDKEYPIIHTVLIFCVAASIKDVYLDQSMKGLSPIWDRYIRDPSMYKCIELLDKPEQSQNDDQYSYYLTIAFIGCLLFSSNCQPLYSNWKQHVLVIHSAIIKAEELLPDMLKSPTGGAITGEQAFFYAVRNWAKYIELLSVLTSDDGNDLLENRNFVNELNCDLYPQNLIFYERNATSMFMYQVYPTIQKIIKNIIHWKYNGILLCGTNFLYFKYTNMDLSLKKAFYEFGNSILTELNETMFNDKLDKALNSIKKYKDRFTFKMYIKLQNFGTIILIKLFYMNVDEESPLELRKLLGEVLETWYSISNFTFGILCFHATFYYAALASILIKDDNLESHFITLLEELAARGSFLSKNYIRKLYYIKQIITLKEYDRLMQPKYDFLIC